MRTMGPWHKLRQASNYLRKLRPSRGPDSYFQYKLGRDRKRRQADHAREQVEDSAEREREKAERERGYQERYTRERDSES
jgi:fatty acid desaturase